MSRQQLEVVVVEAGQRQVPLQEGDEGVGGALEKIEAGVKQQVVLPIHID